MQTQLNLIHSDCLEGMKKMDDESIDLVVTSPPYNIGIDYGTYDDSSDRDNFIQWCQDWAAQVHRVLKPEGSFFLNLGAAPANPLLPHQLLLALTQDSPTFHPPKHHSLDQIHHHQHPQRRNHLSRSFQTH